LLPRSFNSAYSFHIRQSYTTGQSVSFECGPELEQGVRIRSFELFAGGQTLSLPCLKTLTIQLQAHQQECLKVYLHERKYAANAGENPQVCHIFKVGSSLSPDIICDCPCTAQTQKHLKATGRHLKRHRGIRGM
jgi:hypothetical protein